MIRKAIVFHADILGFKEALSGDDKQQEELLAKMKEALAQGINMLKQYIEVLVVSKIKVVTNYKIFSDNLYASFAYEDDNLESFSDAFITCILFARSYYSIMLDNKLPIRGAISYGNDYSDEDIIFSVALVKAYTLESEKAKYPRVIIDDSLVEKIKNGIAIRGELLKKCLNNTIVQDVDGISFLNPTGLNKDFGVSFDGYSVEHSYKGLIGRDLEFAREALVVMKEKNRPNEIAKYEWLIDILTWYLLDQQVKSKNRYEV
ncbi:MAG: hypothetical protein RLZZ367_957, partial [Bacteroidota bacterium]